MKIPFNPISILTASVWKKRARHTGKSKFPSLLQGGKETFHASLAGEPITKDATPESQQALVQHLLRVQELKGRVAKQEHKPSLKYLHTENITRDYVLSSMGTKQKRNLEILISDEKPPARSSSQSKGK